MRENYLHLKTTEVSSAGRSVAQMHFVMSWMDEIADADVAIVNAGAHHREPKAFRRTIAAALEHLRGVAEKSARIPRVLFRNTPSGHPNCWEYDGPITDDQWARVTIGGKYRTE